MKLYKITDKDGKTRAGHSNETQWGENVTHKAEVRGKELCTNEVIHAYTDPYLAVFFNPIGGSYNEETMHLWEAKGRVCSRGVDKVGCKTLTTVRRIPKPSITREQRVEIAIKCALVVCQDKDFVQWAENWLSGKDRTEAAAWDARAAAEAQWQNEKLREYLGK